MLREGEVSSEEIVKQEDRAEQKRERREKIVSVFIENRVIALPPDFDYDPDVLEGFVGMSVGEKVNLLYEKIMARHRFLLEASKAEVKEGEEFFAGELPEVDPYLLSEIKALWSDEAVKRTFVEKYYEAVKDDKTFKISELGINWQELGAEISENESKYANLNRQIFLGQISRPDQLSASKSKLRVMANKLISIRERQSEIVSLDGLPEVSENTDIAAEIQYQELCEYRAQAKEGFVWLPSRRKIHQETVAALQNGRWPVLIGEAGTGKSEQAVAAARELTGESPTKLACSERTNDNDMIGKTAMDANGQSYIEYGPVMQAFTGCEDSRQPLPSHSGRIVRFDESGRLGTSGYATVKELRQLKTGDTFHGKKVLHGASSIWTTNPTGPRYPDRADPDPAMRRELSYINVDYPAMSEENPELYEFMIATLMDENNHIVAFSNEVAPGWQRLEVGDEVLPDGREVVAKQEINPDRKSKEHGYLYRLSYAIKAVQDAFITGNTDENKDGLLRYSVDSDGKTTVVENGGQTIELSTSTITLGEIASWMKGFNSRSEKANPDFQAHTLAEWLRYKINLYIQQSDSEDRDKIRAIFEHYHLFDPVDQSKVANSKPMTPKEIGYLSPRVPRPLEIRQPVASIDEQETEVEKPAGLNLESYSDSEVLSEDGTRVRITPLQRAISPTQG